MPFTPATTCDVTIDVSHHQGNIDWAAVKQTGIQCVMIKATQGLTKDSLWEVNRDGAKAQGLLVIPYTFLTTAAGAAAQAQFFVETAGLAAGMPAALDWEGDNAPDAAFVEQVGLAAFHVFERLVEEVDRDDDSPAAGVPLAVRQPTEGAFLPRLGAQIRNDTIPIQFHSGKHLRAQNCLRNGLFQWGSQWVEQHVERRK